MSGKTQETLRLRSVQAINKQYMRTFKNKSLPFFLFVGITVHTVVLLFFFFLFVHQGQWTTWHLYDYISSIKLFIPYLLITVLLLLCAYWKKKTSNIPYFVTYILSSILVVLCTFFIPIALAKLKIFTGLTAIAYFLTINGMSIAFILSNIIIAFLFNVKMKKK